jgi:opacity protein-like surface antigen
MSIFSSRSGLALVVAALCLGGPTVHAQSGPVNYWTPGWPLGFGGDPAAGQGANSYGNFPGFDGSDARGGFSYSRTNFSNGWFVGSEGGRMGMGMTGANQAFGNMGSLNYQGVQFGYNFGRSSEMPVTFYAGVDTLKYNTGIGNTLAPFNNLSGTLGYSAHAGVEFKPASNVSLGLGFGYTQQSPRLDSNVNSLTGSGDTSARPGDSAFAIIGRP